VRRLVAGILAGLALFAPDGLAQNAITQEGTVLQNSPMMFRGNHRARQGAPVGGAPSGQTVTTGDSVVGGRCDYSAPTDSPDGYYRLCIDAKTGTIVSDGTKSPPAPLTFIVNGISYTVPIQATFTGTDINVPHNVALQALSGTAGQRVLRLGFRAPGDGGMATYNWSASNCTAADNGAQIQPSGVTGCWVADFSGYKPTPVIWGAWGNGTTDDTAAVQAAVDALAGKTLYIGPYRYCIGTPGILTYRPINIQGETRSAMADSPASDKYGFTACALNVTILTLGNNGTTSSSGGVIENVLFDAGTAGANSSGAAIVNNGTYGNEIRNVRINKACIGIDEQKSQSGRVSGVAIRSEFQPLGANCGGIRIGAASTSAGTVDYHISDVHVDAPGSWSLLVMDAGGLFVTASDFLLSKAYGVWIVPGQNQAVLWMTANHSYLADQSCGSGLLIDTGHSSAVIAGLHFTQTWTASAGTIVLGDSTCPNGGFGVSIKNSNNGRVDGIHFVGHRSLANSLPGFYIGPATHNVTIDDSVVCGNASSNVNYDGIEIAAGAVEFAIRNSRIGGDCDNTVGVSRQRYGIGFDGSASYYTITGNDLRNNLVAAMGGTVPTADGIIDSNLGLDEQITNVAAAATIAAGFPPTVILTGGTASIGTVNGLWPGRTINVFARDAAQNFVTGVGGNLCDPLSLVAGSVAILRKIPGANCISVK
jgi:hypothetical protein